MEAKIEEKLSANIRVTVPGSLILMGEYFITLPQNKALCMAIDRYAILDVKITLKDKAPKKNNDTLPRVSITSDYGFKQTTWHSLEKFSMWKIALTTFGEMQNEGKMSLLFEKRIECLEASIDSSQFFLSKKAEGDDARINITKLGLGSSECSAVLVCSLVLISKNLNPLSDKKFLALLASRVHYVWQDNKGSGYGVYAAIFGGLAVYIQDKEVSSWKNVSLIDGGSIYYVFGGKAKKTKSAIQSFKSFMMKDRETLKKLQEVYLKAMKDLELKRNNLDYSSLCTLLLKAKKIGLQLGMLLDFPADCSSVSKKYECYFENTQVKKKATVLWKSTGAGNESIVRISSETYTSKQNRPPEMFEIKIAKGIRMNPQIRQ